MPGAAQKRVYVALAQHLPLVVALALDRDMQPEVNLATRSTPMSRPVSSSRFGQSGQRRTSSTSNSGLLPREPHEQLLEPTALLRLVPALRADSVQHRAGPRPAAEIHPCLPAVHETSPVIEPPAP